MTHWRYHVLCTLACHNGGPLPLDQLDTITLKVHPRTFDVLQLSGLIALTPEGFILTPLGRAHLAEERIG